ncbi:MAG: hypothetical protein ACJAS1_006712 [Oleiphilaceae bacterium]|jgi:hypothetical protein
MSFNTLAPALMEDDLQKEFDTPLGLVRFINHKPRRNCLWISMHEFQGAELDVDTYITSSNLERYGFMMTVRRKAHNAGHKQKEYKLIEKVMNYIIENNELQSFDTNKF